MVDIKKVDYANPAETGVLVDLLNAYAQDPMGGGESLPDDTRKNLGQCLGKVHGAFSLVAYVNGEPAGLTNCFETFSTFKCKPLINIHDLAVMKSFRGQRVSQALLESVEDIARERGCCKITLEVLEGNTIARNAYLKFGFSGYELDPAMGSAQFWQKVLQAES